MELSGFKENIVFHLPHFKSLKIRLIKHFILIDFLAHLNRHVIKHKVVKHFEANTKWGSFKNKSSLHSPEILQRSITTIRFLFYSCLVSHPMSQEGHFNISNTDVLHISTLHDEGNQLKDFWLKCRSNIKYPEDLLRLERANYKERPVFCSALDGWHYGVLMVT